MTMSILVMLERDLMENENVKNAPNNIENLHTDSIIKAIDIADVNNIELINYNNKKSFSDNIKTLSLNKFDK